MKFLEWLFGIRKTIRAPNKWRLVPDSRGTYTLEMYSDDLGIYLAESVRVTPEEADKQISRLEGKILYYRESEGEG